MDDDFSKTIRNLIFSLALVPILALIVLFVFSYFGLPGHGARPVAMIICAIGVIVTGAVAKATSTSVLAAFDDVNQRATVAARSVLAPAARIEREQPKPRPAEPPSQLRPTDENQRSYADMANRSVAAQPRGEAPSPGTTRPSNWPNLAHGPGLNPANLELTPLGPNPLEPASQKIGEAPTLSMLTNLIKRSQAMLDRQIDLVDELESKEENPAYLEKLFKIDHLANRMRRNADGLLVLSGADLEQRLGGPVSILDVLRVSIGEVEDHQRVELVGNDNSLVASGSALPLAHMVAELIENAIEFSPPTSTVQVSGRRLESSAGYEIRVMDSGIGMTTEQLAEANSQLSRPTALSGLSGHTVGLSVVGRLAESLDVAVSLQNNVEAGVTALVAVPPTMLAVQMSPDVDHDRASHSDEGSEFVNDAAQRASETLLLGRRNRPQSPSSALSTLRPADDALPSLRPVEAERVDRVSRSGLPILDRDEASPSSLASSHESRPSISLPARSVGSEGAPVSPLSSTDDVVQPQHPAQPSHRKPAEIQEMMRRYRQGQSGTQPAPEGVDEQ